MKFEIGCPICKHPMGKQSDGYEEWRDTKICSICSSVIRCNIEVAGRRHQKIHDDVFIELTLDPDKTAVLRAIDRIGPVIHCLLCGEQLSDMGGETNEVSPCRTCGAKYVIDLYLENVYANPFD
jgi:hypothetical protein